LTDKEFDDLKKEIMPIELQEHFAKNRQVFQNNINKFEGLTKQLSSIKATDEQKAILALILDLGQSLYGTANVLLEHNEMSFFSAFILRQELDRLRSTLNQQGIEIDDIAQYKDGLRFVDDYIKHASKDDTDP
jgi:hypothetical protein